MANRVVHFELGAVEPERAAKFYSKVFDWKINKFPGPQDYWLATTGSDGQPGINGGIMRHKDAQPRTFNTIQVESIEDAVQKIEAKGGTMCVPKMAITSVGWLAYGKDTEGNLFGIMVPDPSAK